MRKQVFGRQLKRDANERKALFYSLMSSLVLKEQIETTEQKAKAVKGEIEKMVTKAKKQNSQAKKMLEGRITYPALNKLLSDIAPRFTTRPGGYTRIIRLGRRLGDNASMVSLEWVDKKTQVQAIKVKKETEAKAPVPAKVDKKEKITKKTTAQKSVKKIAKKPEAKRVEKVKK